MIPNIPNLSTLRDAMGTILLSWIAAKYINDKGGAWIWPGTIVIWGPPGVGKTTAITAATAVLTATAGKDPQDSLIRAIIRIGSGQIDREIQSRDFSQLRPPKDTNVEWRIHRFTSLAGLDPTDFTGAPTIVQSAKEDSPEIRVASVLARPAILPDPNPKGSKPYVGQIVIIEDLATATPRTAHAVAPLLIGTPARTAVSVDSKTLDVKFYELSPYTRVVADSNIPGQGVVGLNPISSFVRSRCINVGMGIEPTATQIAANPLIQPTAERVGAAHPLVRVFLTYGGGILQCTESVMETCIAFPNNRTWEFVTALCEAVDDLRQQASYLDASERALFIQNLKKYLEATVCGAVGIEMGSSFMAFAENVSGKVPSIELILSNPQTAPLPDFGESVGVIMYTLFMLVNGIQKAVKDQSTLHLPPKDRPEGCLIKYLLRVLLEKPDVRKHTEVVAAMTHMLAVGLRPTEIPRLEPYNDELTQIIALVTGELKVSKPKVS